MYKFLSVVLVILLATAGAYPANMARSNEITAAASGSVQLNQISYSAGSGVPIDYSYAGLPVKAGNVLVLQTLCSGTWNGMVFDTSSQFFQSDTIAYSSSNGSGADVVTIPSNYQGSGSCTVSFYLLFTVNNNRYSKTLATSTFAVIVP